MNTIIKTIRPNAVAPNQLLQAGEIIRSGGLVAFPTETVYGLGANTFDEKAVGAVFDAKGRPHDNPLIVHVAFPEECSDLADTSASPLFKVISERFMPGPITVILPKKEIVPDVVTVSLPTVALRCPEHPVAHALICAAGVPIAAPSANLSGRPSPTTAQHVIEDMDGRIDMIIDGGPCSIGLESTVILLEGDTIHLLRPGYITYEDLCQVTPNVVINPAVLEKLNPGERPASPGMKYRHYAPKAPVTMVQGRDDRVLLFFREKLAEGCGILCFDEDLEFLQKGPNASLVIPFGKKKDLLTQAKQLFSALRLFDSTGVKQIFARYTAHDHLGLAVSNRLLRACAFQIITV